jgi:hypothetical protein
MVMLPAAVLLCTCWQGPDKGVLCWNFQQWLSSSISAFRWPGELEAAMCKKALQLNCQLLELRLENAKRNESIKCDKLTR